MIERRDFNDFCSLCMCLFLLEWPVQYCFDGTWRHASDCLWIYAKRKVGSIFFDLLLISNISHNAVMSSLCYNSKPDVLHFSSCAAWPKTVIDLILCACCEKQPHSSFLMGYCRPWVIKSPRQSLCFPSICGGQRLRVQTLRRDGCFLALKLWSHVFFKVTVCWLFVWLWHISNSS